MLNFASENFEPSVAESFFADRLLFTDMSEILRLGAGELLFAGDSGVLLREKSVNTYLLAAKTEKDAETLLSRIDGTAFERGSGFLVAHGEGARRAAYACLPVGEETACYQAVYSSKAPVPVSGRLELRPPDSTTKEIIKREYRRESPETLDMLCDSGKILCGFERTSGEFVGFIGRHPEGSMGLLLVFPPYRRRGYGEELEASMINLLLSEGLVPYAHIVEDNDVSLRLQKKLGFGFADEKVYWLSVK